MRDALLQRLDVLEEKHDEIFTPLIEYYNDKNLLLDISDEELKADREHNLMSQYRWGDRGQFGDKDCIIKAMEERLGYEIVYHQHYEREIQPVESIFSDEENR
eukprot:UN15590